MFSEGEEKRLCDNRVTINPKYTFKEDEENFIKIYVINEDKNQKDTTIVYCFLPFEIISLIDFSKDTLTIPYADIEVKTQNAIELVKNGYVNWMIYHGFDLTNKNGDKLDSRINLDLIVSMILDKTYNPKFIPDNAISTLIGKGAFGMIFKVHEIDSGKNYIRKLINVSNYNSYHGVLRALNECLIQLTVQDHPNICKIIGSMITPQQIFAIYMEAGDIDLAKYIVDAQCSYDELKHIAIAIGKALMYIHDKRFLFCDLKLENVVMKRDVPLLIDFGLAVEEGTETGGNGTPSYMAPECNSTGNTLYTEYYMYGVFLLKLFSRIDTKKLIFPFESPITASNSRSEIPLQYIKILNDIITSLCSEDPEQRMTINEAINKLEIL